MRKLPALLLTVALSVVASPLAAYVIYLKDGSKVISKDKYRVEGERAIITLPNGTETFLELSAIDVPRTEEANGAGYESAVEIDSGETVSLPSNPADTAESRRRLGDLISERGARPRELPQARREEPSGDPTTLPHTPAGWVDLAALPRRTHTDSRVASTLETLLTTRAGQPVQIYQGSRPGRAFAEITTGSEAAVFRALEASAEALLEARDRLGGTVEALEVLLLTPAGERGGQFVLTPESAAELASERVDVASFFLSHVEF